MISAGILFYTTDTYPENEIYKNALQKKVKYIQSVIFTSNLMLEY